MSPRHLIAAWLTACALAALVLPLLVDVTVGWLVR